MKKFLAILLIVLTTLTSLMFCGCKSDDKLHLTEVTHSLFYTPQYVAMALGYFTDEGLDVEVTNGSGADNVMTALLSGEADVGLLGCEANVYVYLQGKRDFPRVIAQLTKRDGSFLVAREPIENFDYSSAQNKTVLMGRTGGMPAMILQYVLNSHGLVNGQNVTMDYSIQFGVLAPAFTGGTGDFVPLFEPTASELETTGKGYIVSAIGLDSGEIPYTCYSVSSEFAKKHPDKVQKFLSAVWLGVDYTLTHSASEIAVLIEPYFSGTNLELIEKAVQNYMNADVWNESPTVSREAFVRLLDIMQNAGELPSRVEYDSIVDGTFCGKTAK